MSFAKRLLPWFIALATAAWAQTVPPAVLSEPALRSPKAVAAATLPVIWAGHRLVAAGERGIVLLPALAHFLMRPAACRPRSSEQVHAG